MYAYEIVPSTFQLCKQNINLNDLDDKITVFNIGLGKKGSIEIPDNLVGDGGFSTFNLRGNVNGTEITIKSLNEVVDELGIDNAVMKIDCEGCEYEVFNQESLESIRKFSHIMGEYHYGYRKLKEILEEAGFEFSATRPEPFYDNYNENHFLYTGMFSAVRK